MTIATKMEQLTKAKNEAYSERNQLVAFLTSVYPSGLARHPVADTAWEDDWRTIVVVDSPHGQMTWHIHDIELVRFAHLKPLVGYVWDGHTTAEKYRRLRKCAGLREGV